MAGEKTVTDGRAELTNQVLADRFEVLDGPLGWRCLACGAEIRAALAPTDPCTTAEVNRLAESAADHALFCGRCDD